MSREPSTWVQNVYFVNELTQIESLKKFNQTQSAEGKASSTHTFDGDDLREN